MGNPPDSPNYQFLLVIVYKIIVDVNCCTKIYLNQVILNYAPLTNIIGSNE